MTVPACGGYLFRVDSVSYPVNATLDDGWTVTGTLSVGNTDWVSMSDPGYLNNVVGQAYDVLWKGLTLSGSLTYTYPGQNPPPPRTYIFPQDSLVFSIERTGWIDAAQHAAYHYDVASSTFTLPVVVGKDTSGDPVSYPFTLHAILMQEMRVAEHNADNATTATGADDGNLVVPADASGVGHVDLSALFNPMTNGFGGTAAEVIISIRRSDGVAIPGGTYDDLTAGGTLQTVEVALPTTATAADFTITAALAGATPITNLCMAAPALLTGAVRVARVEPLVITITTPKGAPYYWTPPGGGNPWDNAAGATSVGAIYRGKHIALEWHLTFTGVPYQGPWPQGQWQRLVWTNVTGETPQFTIRPGGRMIDLAGFGHPDTDPAHDHISRNGKGHDVWMYDGPGSLTKAAEFLFEIVARSPDGLTVVRRWFYVNTKIRDGEYWAWGQHYGGFEDPDVHYAGPPIITVPKPLP